VAKREKPTRNVEVHRRRRKNGQSSEGTSEARKRKWRRDDASRLVSSFYACFFLSFPLVLSVPAPRSKIKSCRVTPNVITSVFFHLRSIYRFEQTYVNTFARGQLVGQLVHQKCLSATVYLPKLRFHGGRRIPFETSKSTWSRSRFTCSSFLTYSLMKLESQLIRVNRMPMLTMLGVFSL